LGMVVRWCSDRALSSSALAKLDSTVDEFVTFAATNDAGDVPGALIAPVRDAGADLTPPAAEPDPRQDETDTKHAHGGCIEGLC